MTKSISTVTVTREGSELVVSWAGSADVTISVGASPDEAGWHAVGSASARKTRLRGLDPAIRHYVRLTGADGQAVVAAERRLAFEGPVNFRDLGGYPTRDGRHVRWGQLYRSDSLDTLSDADVALLERLGVRLVCDLRRNEERASAPSRIHGHPMLRIEHHPIGGIAAETRTMAGRMMRGEIHELGVQDMAAVYLTILDLHADSFGAIVARAADPGSLPMIVHCTAGKDRTGVACAVLLGALDVTDDAILADYELTAEHYSAGKVAEVKPKLEAAGVEFAKVETFFLARREVMAATLAGIRSRYGSIDGYLTGAGGVNVDVLHRLRSLLLDA